VCSAIATTVGFHTASKKKEAEKKSSIQREKTGGVKGSGVLFVLLLDLL
jgi:hypothetical protein